MVYGIYDQGKMTFSDAIADSMAKRFADALDEDLPCHRTEAMILIRSERSIDDRKEG